MGLNPWRSVVPSPLQQTIAICLPTSVFVRVSSKGKRASLVIHMNCMDALNSLDYLVVLPPSACTSPIVVNKVSASWDSSMS